MSSLHVKYRPKTFSEVLGQERVCASLANVVSSNRGHSFLFTGPSGTGKTTLARILANTIAGSSATDANIEEYDAATNTGIEAIRNVVHRASFRALGSSDIKAIIVDECHALSAAAWKALLKPIEEPPKHVYWMFCSTEPAKIPATIKTRCISYVLEPLSEELLLELICKVADAEGFTSPDAVLECIAENSGGSPRQALVYLEACQHCQSRTEAERSMRAAGQSKDVVDLCRHLLASKGHTAWTSATGILRKMESVEAESVRIVVNNYLAAVLMNTKSDKEASRILRLLEAFKTPYNASEKLAPLLYSIGLALELDRRDV